MGVVKSFRESVHNKRDDLSEEVRGDRKKKEKGKDLAKRIKHDR